MIRIVVKPTISFEGIPFGTNKSDVRNVLRNKKNILPKSIKTSDEITDAYEGFNVYYDINDCAEAIEFYDSSEVLIDGKVYFPGNVRNIKEKFPMLHEDDIGVVSEVDSIGICESKGELKTILFGKKDYFLD